MDSLNESVAQLKPKDKEPNSVATLTKWIDYAERQIGGQHMGRLSWLVASSIAVAKLQQVLDEQGDVRFILKGGTLLQYRLGLETRATRDVDGIVRGDIDSFISLLDAQLREQWGPIGFSRSEVEEIRVPSKIINPRRFHISLLLRSKLWRKVKIEISPDEGKAGSSFEPFAPPSLSGFGLPTPDALVGLQLSYQIAQKIHAASDPHNPPEYINERARDLVDLVLLRNMVLETGSPTNDELKAAIQDIFDARAEEARATGRKPRLLPAQIVALPHWEDDYLKTAKDVGVDLSIEEATSLINEWIGTLQ